MGKLAWKIALFAAVLGGSFALAYRYNPINYEYLKGNDYLLAIFKKHEQLERLPAPRLVFVGGSGAAFGIDSKSIGDSLKMNGFNLGLHAGLGLEFMVSEVLDVARPGDVVVVSTEFYLGQGQLKMLAYMNNHFPKTADYLQLGALDRFSYAYELITADLLDRSKRVQSTLLKGKNQTIKLDTNDYYRSTGFTSRGDYELHLDKERPWGLFTRYDQKEEVYSDGIRQLNRLSALQQNGIKVFYVYPGYPKEEYNRFKTSLQSFDNQLRHGLSFPVLGQLQDFLYPEDEFFDTVYHLEREGRSKRAATIARLLREALQ